jgi:transcriptional regulator with XRE-family HTH domain
MSKENREASESIRWHLASNLRSFREARGYTQERLGKLCGFTKSYISDVEQGNVNITLANLATLADGLGCTEGDLLRRHASSQARSAAVYEVITRAANRAPRMPPEE